MWGPEYRWREEEGSGDGAGQDHMDAVEEGGKGAVSELGGHHRLMGVGSGYAGEEEGHLPETPHWVAVEMA